MTPYCGCGRATPRVPLRLTRPPPPAARQKTKFERSRMPPRNPFNMSMVIYRTTPLTEQVVEWFRARALGLPKDEAEQWIASMRRINSTGIVTDLDRCKVYVQIDDFIMMAFNHTPIELRDVLVKSVNLDEVLLAIEEVYGEITGTESPHMPLIMPQGLEVLRRVPHERYGQLIKQQLYEENEERTRKAKEAWCRTQPAVMGLVQQDFDLQRRIRTLYNQPQEVRVTILREQETLQRQLRRAIKAIAADYKRQWPTSKHHILDIEAEFCRVVNMDNQPDSDDEE